MAFLNRNVKFILFSLIFIFFACTSNPQSIAKPSNTTLFMQNVMTIDYHITIGKSLSVKEKKQIQKIIDDTFQEIDQIYNKWNPTSEISQINQMKSGERKVLSPQLYDFLQKVNRLVALSDGKFDPSLEPIQKLWKHYLRIGQTPPENEILELKPCVGWNKITFSDGFISKQDDRTELDFGGVAKGFAVDLLVERLNLAGFMNIMVEWGGEIRASGEHPDHRPWMIVINRPNDHLNPLAHISLNNCSIATSGDYFQNWEAKDPQGFINKYCHIFNSQTFAPSKIDQHSVLSASVIAKDCFTADALAKVLLLFESDTEIQAWIEKIQKQIPELAVWFVNR